MKKKTNYHIAVVGLGYVGLPLALALGKHFEVLGFDIDTKKLKTLKSGKDPLGEIDTHKYPLTSITYSDNPQVMSQYDVVIVAVPTPIDKNKKPDLSLLENASTLVGKHMKKGSIIVFESTVYPGATKEICIPALEQASGLCFNKDFFVGYSPERINPGDTTHTIDKVTKVVSAYDTKSLSILSFIYGKITKIYKAPSVEVAEAAKVIENTQRDLNIALMNELAMIFETMNISIYDVLDAAKTKWNFLPFTPGLVGGHCIGVDPYYLTHKSELLGYTPELILAGRGINDGIPRYLAQKIVKYIIKNGYKHTQSKVLLWGITFKENVKDIRNSKVASLYHELTRFGVYPFVYDPICDKKEVDTHYDIDVLTKSQLPKGEILIVAVGHTEFQNFPIKDLKKILSKNALIIDIKRIWKKKDIERQGYRYMTL